MKRKRITTPKKRKRPVEKKSLSFQKLDSLFAKYIKMRDAVSADAAKCISCGKIVPLRETDCGHFVNRSFWPLRYSLKNAHAQCRACNRFFEGNPAGYAVGLMRKYGNDILHKFDFIIQSQSKYKKPSLTERNLLIKYFSDALPLLTAKKKAL